MTQDEAKRMAARRALEFVEEGMLLGLGSGTTSRIFIQELGERVKQGLRVRGIATSTASQQLAESLSIPITNFDEAPVLDLAVDGADEVGPGWLSSKAAGVRCCARRSLPALRANLSLSPTPASWSINLAVFLYPSKSLRWRCPSLLGSLKRSA